MQGTLIASRNLLKQVQANIIECACIVELKMLGGYAKLQEKHPGVKVIILIYKCLKEV